MHGSRRRRRLREARARDTAICRERRSSLRRRRLRLADGSGARLGEALAGRSCATSTSSLVARSPRPSRCALGAPAFGYAVGAGGVAACSASLAAAPTGAGSAAPRARARSSGLNLFEAFGRIWLLAGAIVARGRRRRPRRRPDRGARDLRRLLGRVRDQVLFGKPAPPAWGGGAMSTVEERDEGHRRDEQGRKITLGNRGRLRARARGASSARLRNQGHKNESFKVDRQFQLETWFKIGARCSSTRAFCTCCSRRSSRSGSWSTSRGTCKQRPGRLQVAVEGATRS